MALKNNTKKIEKDAESQVIFDSKKCKSILERGKYYKPSNNEIVIDTGDFDIENSNDPYEETIASGIIDHHRIDNLLRREDRQSELKCSAMIIEDFKDAILEMIKKRKVVKTISHSDGDLDSVVSSYLIQSLIQKEKLPASAHNLSKHVNRVDYGTYREPNIDKYLSSLAGIFFSVKKYLEIKNQGNLKEKDNKLNEIIFQILNKVDGNFDYEKDMDSIIKKLPSAIQKIISNGKKIIKKELELFNEDFNKSEKTTTTVKKVKDGSDINIPMIISLEPRIPSIDFINLSYLKTAPETIIAVYAGHKRANGYVYNIGLRLESTKTIDISNICVKLNLAEKQKRENLPKNDKILKKLNDQPDRLNMSGPIQILKKDPCVIVGGGSLISSPRNSLLSKKGFYQTIQM